MAEPRHDKLFYYTLLPFASTSLAIVLLLASILAVNSLPAIERYGLSLLTRNVWSPVELDPEASDYGLLAPLLGTLVTATIATMASIPIAASLVYVSEEVLPARMSRVRSAISILVDVMAGMPTIVYGLWGALVLAPLLLNYVYQPLNKYFGFIPLFACSPYTGLNILTASLLLSIMITPFVFAVVRESYTQIPLSYREASLSLGTTKYEHFRIMLGIIKPSLIAGALLGFGRAASETVAVTLVVGNAFNLPYCLLSPGYTVSALIANQFNNAPLYPYMESVLLFSGAILLLLGLVSNLAGLIMLSRVKARV
ncbi:MAG: phosphate ABC transporter permease subunit PstC [Aeropyrum sp.]|nr:phosphate ABC transporter permease subunit PstC [Aeropyrum sp.]